MQPSVKHLHICYAIQLTSQLNLAAQEGICLWLKFPGDLLAKQHLVEVFTFLFLGSLTSCRYFVV